jgi:ankyrin repeat protein
MIKLFINNGADVSVFDDNGMKPLFLIINNGNITEELSLFLIEKFMEGQEEFIEVWNTEINDFFLVQNIILHIRQKNVLQTMISANIDLNKSTSNCGKPIHIIFQKYADPECVEIILQNDSIDINEEVNNWTPFNICCCYNTYDMIINALTKGYDTSNILKKFRGEDVNYSSINLIEINQNLSSSQRDDLIGILVSIMYG